MIAAAADGSIAAGSGWIDAAAAAGTTAAATANWSYIIRYIQSPPYLASQTTVLNLTVPNRWCRRTMISLAPGVSDVVGGKEQEKAF